MKRTWFILLPVAIGLSFFLHNRILGLVQAILCSLLLGLKLGRELAPVPPREIDEDSQKAR